MSAYEEGDIYDYGCKLERLGLAMQDPSTTIMDLSVLALECDLSVSFVMRFMRKVGDQITDEEPGQ